MGGAGPVCTGFARSTYRTAPPAADSPRTMITLRSLPALALCLLPFVASCGGGGGSGSAPASSADILLTDAPADELLSFNVLVDEVRLYDGFGERTDDLLAGSVRVDLLGTATQLAWLVSGSVPAGTWHGVELTYSAVDARRLDGTQAPVTVVSNRLAAAFATPLAFNISGYKRCVVDFDLVSSLTGDSVAGYTLDPRGIALGDDSPEVEIEVDEIEGRVTGVDTLNNLVSMDAWADDDRSVSLGNIKVAVDPTALLQDDAGNAYASLTAFYAVLVPGATVLEVHGGMAGGQLNATRIQVEDGGPSGGDMVVRLRGVVVGVDSVAQTFDIAIGETKKGYSVVVGALGSVPATLAVAHDAGTWFSLGDGLPATSADLAVGARVDVRFAVFDAAPFVAARVELESEGDEYEGTVTDDSLLPSSFEFVLPSTAPAVQSGDVAGPLVADLAGVQRIWLDAGTQPNLDASWIQHGQRVQVKGPLTGAGAPYSGVDAQEVKIKAGRFDCDALIGLVEGDGYIVVPLVDSYADFGGSVDSGADLHFSASTVYLGDVSSFAEFMDAVDNDSVMPQLRAYGVARPGANIVDVHEVDVRRD